MAPNVFVQIGVGAGVFLVTRAAGPRILAHVLLIRLIGLAGLRVGCLAILLAATAFLRSLLLLL